MASHLVIVESPAKAKTIEKYLGKALPDANAPVYPVGTSEIPASAVYTGDAAAQAGGHEGGD